MAFVHVCLQERSIRRISAAAAVGSTRLAAHRRKRRQSSAPLKFCVRCDERVCMSVSTAHLPLNSRQLVFTSSQAARYLGVSLATIRRCTDAGHISCFRTPGGQRRFSRDQLDGFISSMQRDGHDSQPSEAPASAVVQPPV
jgi:excisionase family DNA binding protein